MAKVHVDVYVIPYLVNRMLTNKKRLEIQMLLEANRFGNE